MPAKKNVPPAPGTDAAKADAAPPADPTTKKDEDKTTPPPEDTKATEEVAKEDGDSEKEFHNYQARRYPIRHPYQEVKIPVSGSVTLFKDGWIDAQVSAKVILDLGPAK